jgi:hypothetical protein
MADMHIQGPDGKMHVYPEGTSDDDILKDMHAIYKPLRGAPPPARAGDPAIMTSPVPSPRAQYVQPYKTDEDWQNVREAMILGEKNRGVIQAIQNTPGRVQRMKEAEEVGKSQKNVLSRIGLISNHCLHRSSCLGSSSSALSLSITSKLLFCHQKNMTKKHPSCKSGRSGLIMRKIFW